jgi:hypothetical protein
MMVRKMVACAVVLLLIPVLMMCHGEYTVWRYMAPYRKLVNAGATEREVIAQEGQPSGIIANRKQFRKWVAEFPPMRFRHLVSEDHKAYVYWADPWSDSEGYVVYILFDNQGRVCQVVLGG